MKVAVVGGGIFGATAAVELAREHRVDLFEAHHDLLLGASRASMGRLHMGYHYPRDPHAGRLIFQARQFADRFPGAISRRGRHYYLLAEDGLTPPDRFAAWCDSMTLPLREAHPPFLAAGTGMCFWVPESTVDVSALRGILRRELPTAGVGLHFGRTVGLLPDYDLIVRATYGQPWPARLRYEVTETAVVRLGAQYAGSSAVVLDGPFCCLDPLPGTDAHLFYDVVHSVHHANVGYEPEIPGHLVPLLDRGPVRTEHSRVEAMLQTARRFLRGLGMPEYVGSLFTVRAVLPDVDATDERPTLVERDGRVISVLGGKIGSAVWAAKQVVQTVHEAALVG